MTDTPRVPHKSRIITNHECPPIPDRSHDWRAVFDWFCDDDEQPTGWGETEAEAVLDLMTQSAEFEDDGSCLEEVTNWAFEGWKTRTGLAPVVKPLEWEETKYGHWVAQSVYGEYTVGFDDGWWAELDEGLGWTWLPEEDPRCFEGLQSGQNAAQKEHKRRILSALDMAPVTPQQAAEE